MALDPKENHKDIKDNVQKERRSFLKKAAYAAPTLVIMGQLTKPTEANALSEPLPPPGITSLNRNQESPFEN